MAVNQKEIPINGGYPLHTYEDVEEIFLNYISSKEDRQRIRQAYDFIYAKHQGQLRKSGEPYYHHLIEVAYIIADLHTGPNTIIAAFLHDVVEDTDTTIDDIKRMWGEEVASLVDALTKIQRLKLSKITSEEFEAEDHRKIFIGMAKDIRVILIKLADRLHNMRTLMALSPERQITMSQETLDVFVPIAHRIGLDKIKSEMEDLCMKYLHPKEYEEITKLLFKKTKYLDKSLTALKKRIADILIENNISFNISSRVKSISSIYNKMYVKGRAFNEIYDILALRIITDTELHCYEILGLIHQSYKPVPGRFKDYIAMPKTNLYQSLHTTIVSGDGNIYEVQIRTKEMDEVAEGGVAAHWAYKEGTGYNSKQEQREIENKLHWFRDFVSISENSDASASEFMETLTEDIFESNVYVFTPKGKVIELPVGSTPVDFAYRIHTKVGDTTVGALVNGMMVPLNTILKTGDMVEIKTSRNSPGPSDGWLEFVRSNSAKQAIKKFIAKKNATLLREERINKGRLACIDAFKDRGIDEEEMMTYLQKEELLNNFNCENVEDLFVAVSGRKPSTGAIIEYLHIKKPIVLPTGGKAKTTSGKDSPVYCKGVGRIAIHLASCCTPIPGDDIIGFITKGKGITVHRQACPNIANQKERLVDVYWRNDLEFATYPVDIIIESSDRPNLLVDIMHTLTAQKVTLTNLSARKNPNTLITTFVVSFYVSDAKRLNDIFAVLNGITGVYNVTRMIH